MVQGQLEIPPEKSGGRGFQKNVSRGLQKNVSRGLQKNVSRGLQKKTCPGCRPILLALLSIARRRCIVCMANRSCFERSAIFLKTGLNNCRTLENEAIVQRRSATLKAFDGVVLQWLSLRFEIRRTFASRFAIVCGKF